MRIYSMTATFGKLEHAVLTLEPGLNVIHAPNEWGKSTWCAFLVAMLYGLDTRAKTTKNLLADKERFLPWSGSPMSGRIDLNWDGRDITIERSTRGRIPLGEFRAYETATGIAVPELTAANCGEVLLGESQNVFRRAGFISLSDLPVTQDETLRRRLNALVTTGDESGDEEKLALGLKELKNRCRYNRSGLLPQAEGERDLAEKTLQELEALEQQEHKLRLREGETRAWLQELENHKAALQYAQAQSDAGRAAEARDARDLAISRLEELENSCILLPDRQEAEEKYRAVKAFAELWDSAHLEDRLMPDPPARKEAPAAFRDMDAAGAMAAVLDDAERYRALAGKGWLAPVVPGCLLAVLGAALLILRYTVYGAGALGLGAILIFAGAVIRSRGKARRRQLAAKYGSSDPMNWRLQAESYAASLKEYERASTAYTESRADLDSRLEALEARRQSLCGSRTPEQMLSVWQQTLQKRQELDNARREAAGAEKHYETVRAMMREVTKPGLPDHLQYTEPETLRLISDAHTEQERLHNRIGQYRGRMDALGSTAALQKQVDALNARIGKLQQMLSALELAQQTLTRAGAELQRRFAPRITRRAQELMAAMTDGRYDKLVLTEDLAIRAGTRDEDTLHSVRWRSAGTADQLYLALRLAVAEELTPHAPLILDDALARCDDERMRAVLAILRDMGRDRQVILFTCQNRETEAI